jgi:hypothetical protein
MEELSRRDFMKVAALTAGGAALAGGCATPAGRAEAPEFDPNDSYWALEQPPANPPLLARQLDSIAWESRLPFFDSRNALFHHGLAYSGQGVNLSFLFGDVIAALHQGNDHGWLATPYANNTLPFIPPEPFRWIGVQAAMKYYDWQDKR